LVAEIKKDGMKDHSVSVRNPLGEALSLSSSSHLPKIKHVKIHIHGGGAAPPALHHRCWGHGHPLPASRRDWAIAELGEATHAGVMAELTRAAGQSPHPLTDNFFTPRLDIVYISKYIAKVIRILKKN
jgi:hypothetical protein